MPKGGGNSRLRCLTSNTRTGAARMLYRTNISARLIAGGDTICCHRDSCRRGAESLFLMRHGDSFRTIGRTGRWSRPSCIFGADRGMKYPATLYDHFIAVTIQSETTDVPRLTQMQNNNGPTNTVTLRHLLVSRLKRSISVGPGYLINLPRFASICDSTTGSG